MKPRRSGLLLVVLMLLGLGGVSTAQRPPVLDLNDAEFARRVREWTTKPEFMSPLIDHLPKKSGVPTPKDILGYHIGEPKN